MFYAPTHFSYIEAIVLKEDYPKYPFIFITAYLNICSSEFFIFGTVNYRRLKAGGIPLHRIPIEKT
jgi:hypothetical protein